MSAKSLFVNGGVFPTYTNILMSSSMIGKKTRRIARGVNVNNTLIFDIILITITFLALFMPEPGSARSSEMSGHE